MITGWYPGRARIAGHIGAKIDSGNYLLQNAPIKQIYLKNKTFFGKWTQWALSHPTTLSTLRFVQWRSEGPAGPATTGARGADGFTRGPPGRSSRRNPLASGPNNLFTGGGRKSSLRYWLLANCWIQLTCGLIVDRDVFSVFFQGVKLKPCRLLQFVKTFIAQFRTALCKSGKTYVFCHCIEINRNYILDIIFHQYTAWQIYFPSKIEEGGG